VKGYKTIAFGALLVVVPPLTSYFGGVDWGALGLSPAAAGTIGVIVIALRAITSSPVFKS
jgi:hypothetical protein